MPDRIIKESICTSDTLNELTWFEEVFWHRLTVNCDDYGRFDARPLILKNRLFPLKESVTTKCIQDVLDKLSTVGLVTTYVCEGRPYLQLITWAKHQRIRAKKSKYPSPNDSCRQLTADDSECPRNPIQSESNPNYVDSDADASKPTVKEVDNFFEAIWALYPEKKGKGQVSKSKKQALFKIGFEDISQCINRYKADKPDWQKWQNGATFFNSGYVDYLDGNYAPPEDGDKGDDYSGYITG